MNVPLLSFSLLSRKKSPSPKKNITKKQIDVIVYADEFQDLSPTEEMINKRQRKIGVDNNITTLEKEIKKLKLMTDGVDHSGQSHNVAQQLTVEGVSRPALFGDIIFLKKQIKRLEKRSKSPKKGGHKRTSRKFRNC